MIAEQDGLNLALSTVLRTGMVGSRAGRLYLDLSTVIRTAGLVEQDGLYLDLSTVLRTAGVVEKFSLTTCAAQF